MYDDLSSGKRDTVISSSYKSCCFFLIFFIPYFRCGSHVIALLFFLVLTKWCVRGVYMLIISGC